MHELRVRCCYSPWPPRILRPQSTSVSCVCIVLFDCTDTAIYRTMHQAAMVKLEEASRLDGLTQLFNRAHWQSRLVEEFSRARRYKHPMSLLLFDLDHFKSINDTYGHLAGDAVLIKVADLVRDSLRESDVAGRYGGEEFGIILPDTSGPGAMVVAERLRQSVESTLVSFEKLQIAMSISIGVAEFSATFSNAEDMIAKADEALYKAKQAGRNRVILDA